MAIACVFRMFAAPTNAIAIAGPSSSLRDNRYAISRPNWVTLRSSSLSQWRPMPSQKHGAKNRGLGSTNGTRWTAMTWQDTTARIEVDVPVSVAWDLWSDREGLNRWMPWIASIKVLKDQPELSQWTLKYNAFGQDFEFSWLARNLQPIHYQKIHWRSLDGLPNRGAVRFYPRGSSSCGIEVTISYEVPGILAGVASALSPLVQSILQSDLERFASLAKSYHSKSSTK